MCKDPGGTNGVLPVFEAWVRTGGIGVLIANGKATELLPSGALPFRWYPTPPSALTDFPRPAALVTSMCGDGGIGRNLVSCYRGVCPTIALQDFWGGQLCTSWAAPEHRPDVIVVNDPVGAHVVRRAWRDMDPAHIVTIGYPALDRFAIAPQRTDATREATRRALGVEMDEHLVLVCGQLAHSGMLLSDVVGALAAIGTPATIIPRAHPRMVNDAPMEAQRWEHAIAACRGIRCITETSQVSTDTLVGVATVVVSMYSTVLIEAATLRTPAIAVLYPDAGMAEFRQSTGDLMPELPIVELGACAKATDRASLIAALIATFDGSLATQLRPAQERAFTLDGKNATRIAAFIAEQIRSFRPTV